MGKTIIISNPDEKQVSVSTPKVKGVVVEPQKGGGGGGGTCLFTQAAVEEAVAPVLEAAQGAEESADQLAQFFGVTLLEGYEFMQDTEVCGELEDIMRIIDPNLTAAQAAAITAQTLNNPSES